MATYLLTWNPKAWNWEDLDQCIEALKEGGQFEAAVEPGKIDMGWSTGVTKRIVEGDRCFLMRLGVEPKGIMGSGHFVGSYYEAPSWNGEPGKTALFAPIQFDKLLHPTHEQILSLQILKSKLPAMNWTPQASGQSIPDNVAKELESLWREVLKQNSVPQTECEGALRRVITNTRERSAKARRQCIAHYGWDCAICKFNYGDFYGEIGKDMIHVHHLTPLSQAFEERKVDPIKDLRPVCANCHQVIHAQKEACTLDQVRKAIQRKIRQYNAS